MIDVTFYDVPVVRSAWKALFDSFSKKASNAAEDAVLAEERQRLLVDLLYSMAKDLSFDFDKTDIKNQAYSSQYQADTEVRADFMSASLAKMLHKEEAFRMTLTSVPEDETQIERRKVLLELYKGDRPFPVRIVSQGNS
jgi:hypothetical protein